MNNFVQCVVLNIQAEAMDSSPHPGEIGIRIFNSVSKEGWNRWMERLTSIIHENKLSTADPETIKVIEKHMLGFFFGEGDYGKLPSGFQTNGEK